MARQKDVSDKVGLLLKAPTTVVIQLPKDPLARPEVMASIIQTVSSGIAVLVVPEPVAMEVTTKQ